LCIHKDWDNYKSVFRHYEQIKPILNSNQEKIDYWVITFSRQSHSITNTKHKRYSN